MFLRGDFIFTAVVVNKKQFHNKRLDKIRCGRLSFRVLSLKRQSLLKRRKIKPYLPIGRTIFSTDFIQPKPIFSDRFKRAVFINGIISLFANVGELEAVLLIDIRGRYADLAKALLAFFRTVRVYTLHQSSYEMYAQELLYDMGAAVIIETELEYHKDIEAVVSPEDILPENLVSGKGLNKLMVISPNRAERLENRSIHSFCLTFPSEYNPFLPLGIDKDEFLFCLYEFCGIKEVAALPIEYVCIGENKIKFG